jgi:MFS family permease
MVSHETVVSSILGAAAGLGGLTLVFLGLVVTAYQERVRRDESLRRRYERLSAFVLAAFVASIACVALATAWLLDQPGQESLYVAVVVTFFASLVILLAATVIVVRRLLSRHD